MFYMDAHDIRDSHPAGKYDSQHPAEAPSVMVVDDDPALARMLALTLRDSGFDVTAARNGQEALSRITDDHDDPDVIILDLEMPVMDGRTFFRRLRAKGMDIPVLILSAYEARRGQRELGADAYLNKPFNPEDLVDSIERLLVKH